MADKWPTHIRKRGHLTICPTTAFLQASAWTAAMAFQAISEFNRLAQLYKLPVEFKVLDKLPQPDGLGADVSIDVHSGTGIYFDRQGQKTVPLPDGKDEYRGYTQPTFTGGSQADPGFFCWKMFIFMRKDPVVDGSIVGPRVRTAVLLHEMIHTLGLHEDSPTHGLKGAMAPRPRDLFSTGGIFTPYGSKYDVTKDYLDFLDCHVPEVSGAFKLSNGTINSINENWSLGP